MGVGVGGRWGQGTLTTPGVLGAPTPRHATSQARRGSGGVWSQGDTKGEGEEATTEDAVADVYIYIYIYTYIHIYIQIYIYTIKPPVG